MNVRPAVYILCCVLATSFPANATCAETQGDLKAVLVTGASSGIGRTIAEALASNGYFVYAGARKQVDLDELNTIDNVQSIRLDVTVQGDIDAAVETVRREGRGLYALVNNAGVLFTGPATEVPIDQVRWLFDVNVFGVFRVTQAFAPLIIESKGRILNVGSVAGNIGIRFLGPYSMSKHAIEAYTDALAAELAPLGVHVSVIAPGDYASNIWSKDIDMASRDQVVDKSSPYSNDYQDWIEMVANMELKEPDEVAETAVGILSADIPRRRYLVVPNDGEMAWVIGSAVQRLAELNARHAHSYTQAELTGMLLDAMAELEDSGDQNILEDAR